MHPTYTQQEEHLRYILDRFLNHMEGQGYDITPSVWEGRDQLLEGFIKNQPRSVVMVIQNEHGKLLSVTRPGRPKDLALVGGKIDPGENPLQAVIRETREETGLEVLECTYVYTRLDPSDKRVAWCYRADCWKGEARTCEKGIEVQWVKPAELLTEECTFRHYNEGLFKALGLI